MTPRVAGQLALVTGATAGIGKAIAHRLAQDGANLVLWARRSRRLARLAEEIAAETGVTVDTGTVDVSDCDGVRDESEHVIGSIGAPDIVVNNAGVAVGMASVQEADIDAWNRMIDTNVKGVLFVSRAFLPAMLARGSGHVVNIGSIAGRQVYPRGNVYCASKYAVRAITEGSNLDLLGSGVRVSGVTPGLVETEFSLVRFGGDEERARAVYEGANALRPGDVADVVSFVVNTPPRVNVADVVVFPSSQGSMHHILRDGG